MKIRAAYLLVILCLITSLLLSSCVIPGAVPAATSTPEAPAATATATPKPTSTPKPTATLDLAATQQVETFAMKAKDYFDLGYISSPDGSYDRLDEYEDSWAQIGWYQWLPTGYSP